MNIILICRQFLVKGCMSKAWLIPSFDGQTVTFAADSEATIVKGIISVLVGVYSGIRVLSGG